MMIKSVAKQKFQTPKMIYTTSGWIWIPNILFKRRQFDNYEEFEYWIGMILGV